MLPPISCLINEGLMRMEIGRKFWILFFWHSCSTTFLLSTCSRRQNFVFLVFPLFFWVTHSLSFLPPILFLEWIPLKPHTKKWSVPISVCQMLVCPVEDHLSLAVHAVLVSPLPWLVLFSPLTLTIFEGGNPFPLGLLFIFQVHSHLSSTRLVWFPVSLPMQSFVDPSSLKPPKNRLV